MRTYTCVVTDICNLHALSVVDNLITFLIFVILNIIIQVAQDNCHYKNFAIYVRNYANRLGRVRDIHHPNYTTSTLNITNNTIIHVQELSIISLLACTVLIESYMYVGYKNSCNHLHSLPCFKESRPQVIAHAGHYT